MDKIYEETLLYDFYGELLTKRQKEIYEEAVLNDCSLGEIAEQYGISRQGVHDNLKRTGRTLHEYEEKLGLVAGYLRNQKLAAKARKIIGESGDKELLSIIDKLTE